MSNFVGCKTKDGRNMNVLKIKQENIVLNLNGEQQSISGDSNVYPNLTFPIPFDKNNDNLNLIVDLSLTSNGFAQLDQRIGYNSYTKTTRDINDNVTYSIARINVYNYSQETENIDKVKIINNLGQVINIPEDGIGTPYYGSSICFEIDQNMFKQPNQSSETKNYQTGKAYYGRFTWIDSENNADEWKGFTIKYDAVMAKPIYLPQIQNANPIYQITQPSNNTSFYVNYLNGCLQTVSNPNDLLIDLDNVNLPYGKKIELIVDNNSQNKTINITRDGNNIKTISSNNSYLITIMHLDIIRAVITQLY